MVAESRGIKVRNTTLFGSALGPAFLEGVRMVVRVDQGKPTTMGAE